MGNSASSGHADAPRPPSTPAPPVVHVHRSLRTKKKSLELPDLASLSLTPASSSLNSPGASPHPHYRRPKASSPIPIPAQSAAANQNAAHPYQSYPRPSQLPSTTDVPSTHIPLFPPQQRHRPTPTPSFARAPLPAIDDEDREPEPRPEFVPETIASTIPLGLRTVHAHRAAPDEPRAEPVLTKISWHGGGRSVQLARAGDNNWKGRQTMDRDTTPDTFSTYVPLLPGTHHIKFLVDDVWRVAHDLPTAVDDDGSLANYVHVAFAASHPHPPHAPPPVHTTSSLPPHPHQISFWSHASSSSDALPRAQGNPLLPPGTDGPWTGVVPPALLAAAREEEAYLANGAQGGAPCVPPAPVLPRHLDKLILNVRGPVSGAVQVQKERRREGGAPRGRARLAMTSASAGEDGEREREGIPVTTASGTDVTAHLHTHSTGGGGASRGRTGAGGTGGSTGSGGAIPGAGTAAAAMALADDASVLPVPSHVVLHHLSTSAIRNGVLAVGNTTRYKKKFITTIYYKPT